MRKVALVPVWALTKLCLWALPESHALKRSDTSLSGWNRNAKPLAELFGWILWPCLGLYLFVTCLVLRHLF
jgi:hypothetical protein